MFPGSFREIDSLSPEAFASKPPRPDLAGSPLVGRRPCRGPSSRRRPPTTSRERCAAGEPVRPVAVSRTPRNRRLRPERWADALEELRNLQAEYEEWRAGLPESLADSRTAQLLENVCDVDLEELDIELPRGFARD